MNTAVPVIEARKLGRSFGTTHALRDIDLTLGSGALVGIVGPDGSGKTTLMQLLAAILDPSSGDCRVLGFDSVQEAAQINARVGYMSQGFTLYDRLTVAENLHLAGRIRNLGGADLIRRESELLSLVGLADFPDRRAGRLSGGMRKKLALCCNLIHRPPLLLLDEPTLGVDPLSRQQLWKLIEEFRQQGSTILVTTPYMEEAEGCEQVIMLNRGLLVAQGTPDELRQTLQGSVFTLATENTASAETLLGKQAALISLERLAVGVRFQWKSNSLPAELQADLQRFGELAKVDAGLEDVFIALGGGGGQQDSAAVPGGSLVQPVHGLAIEARDLVCRFGRFVAVDRVSFSVRPGEVVALAGPNGAGKTTLMRALVGLRAADEGAINVAGVDVVRQPGAVRQRIGYMAQRFSLYNDLTVLENLQFFASVYGLRDGQRGEAIRWAQQMVGLEGMDEQPVAQLSAAVAQRLALACAVLHGPAVLFLDEPTSGVDPVARRRFWRLVLGLAEQGMAVVVSTHHLAETHYCHRLALMAQGRLMALGTLEELRQRIGVPGGRVEELFVTLTGPTGPADKVAA